MRSVRSIRSVIGVCALTAEVSAIPTTAAAQIPVLCNDTSVSAVTPPGAAGAADVVLTDSGGSVTDASAFTYPAGPGI